MRRRKQRGRAAEDQGGMRGGAVVRCWLGLREPACTFKFFVGEVLRVHTRHAPPALEAAGRIVGVLHMMRHVLHLLLVGVARVAKVEILAAGCLEVRRRLLLCRALSTHTRTDDITQCAAMAGQRSGWLARSAPAARKFAHSSRTMSPGTLPHPFLPVVHSGGGTCAPSRPRATRTRTSL